MRSLMHSPATVQSPGHITAPSSTDDSDEEYKELLMTRFPALQNCMSCVPCSYAFRTR